MFYLVIGLIVLFLCWLWPIKREVIIEGKFSHEDRDMFTGRTRVFCFHEFCKECLEKWHKTGKEPETLYSLCTSGVPKSSINVGIAKPEKDKIYKITAWKTIFGTIRIYSVDFSDYAWVDPRDEKLRFEALGRGYTDVEEYRKIREQEWREKCILEAMKEHGLTRDEAEILEHFGTFEIRDREAKRLGKSLAELEEALHKSLREAEDCYEINGCYLAKKYIKERFLDSDVRAHLNKCSSCNLGFIVALHGSTDEDREKIDAELNLRSCPEIDAEELGITVEELYERREKNMTLRWGHGEGCYTMKERIVYARTGILPTERLSHQEACLGCQRMLTADREDFLQTGKIGTLKMKEWRESKSKSEAV